MTTLIYAAVKPVTDGAGRPWWLMPKCPLCGKQHQLFMLAPYITYGRGAPSSLLDREARRARRNPGLREAQCWRGPWCWPRLRGRGPDDPQAQEWLSSVRLVLTENRSQNAVLIGEVA